MKKILPLIASLIMMLAMGMTVFAAPGDVISNNGEIICSEGSYNVTVFGKALSVAGVNETTIMPNNATTKMDAMVNGKTYKGVNRIVVLKDDNRDKIVLEKGSYILDATKLTSNQTNRAVRSLIGTVVAPSNMAGIELVYMIGENGKVLDASGVAAATMLKTECNYISTNDNFATFAKEQEEAYKASQPSQSTVSSGSSDKPAPAPTPDPGPTPTSFKKVFYFNASESDQEDIDMIGGFYNEVQISLDGNKLTVSDPYGIKPIYAYYGDVTHTGYVPFGSTGFEGAESEYFEIKADTANLETISYSEGEEANTYTATISSENKDSITFVSAAF